MPAKRKRGLARLVAGGERIGGESELERFHQALEDVRHRQCGGNQAALARQLNLPPTRISEWKSRDSVPGRDALEALGRAFGISVDWILFGEGSMYRRQGRSSTLLAGDLAEHIQRSATAMIRNALGMRRPHTLDVDGEEALREITEIIAARAMELAHRQERLDATLSRLRTVDRGLGEFAYIAAHAVDDTQQGTLARSRWRLARELESVLDEAPAAAGEARGVRLRFETDGPYSPRIRGKLPAELRAMSDALHVAQAGQPSRPGTFHSPRAYEAEEERLDAAERERARPAAR